MISRIRVSAALISLAAVAGGFCVYSKDRAEAATRPRESRTYTEASQQPAANSKAPPASEDAFYGPGFDALAWGLFLEAMAPTNGHLAVETWPEQCQLNPNAIGCPAPATIAAAAKAGDQGKVVRVLHGSPVAEKMAGSDCSAMRTTPVGGYPPPSNLTRNAMFCEEVHASPPEAAFLKRSGLTTLVGQRTYGNTHGMAINFPGTGMNEIRRDLDSVEVKLDWAPSTSFSRPTFACPDPTNHLYTETINGTCYALVGIHITSKSMIRWLWATFEPSSDITNPNRCDPSLYGACLDSWGTTSSQPYGKGQTAQQSSELHQAMAAAHLNPAFANYFLTGVQAEFVSGGKPTVLGNSFVEYNQGVPPGKSSCITCHQYAAFDGRQPAPGSAEDNFGRPPHGWPYIGYACNRNQNDNCNPVLPHSTTQDFSWMLGLMPYGGAGANPRAAVSMQRRPAPETIAERPLAAPAPGLPANQPLNEARVRWDSRGLEIEAYNSSLLRILDQVLAGTGARLQGIAQDQRIFGTYGPGPAGDVLSKLLDGSGYNVLMIGGHDTHAPLAIVLSVSPPASPQTAANNRNRSNSEDDETDPPPEPPRPPPMQTPFGNGDSGKSETPQQIMQDILDRQQTIDQQQEDQQNRPRQ